MTVLSYLLLDNETRDIISAIRISPEPQDSIEVISRLWPVQASPHEPIGELRKNIWEQIRHNFEDDHPQEAGSEGDIVLYTPSPAFSTTSVISFNKAIAQLDFETEEYVEKLNPTRLVSEYDPLATPLIGQLHIIVVHPTELDTQHSAEGTFVMGEEKVTPVDFHRQTCLKTLSKRQSMSSFISATVSKRGSVLVNRPLSAQL